LVERGQMDRYLAEEYFDLERTAHGELFRDLDRVWEALPRIAGRCRALLAGRAGGRSAAERFPGAHIGADVLVGDDCTIEAGATLQGPVVVGEGCVVRAGAYLRGNVLVGRGCVLGNSCEFKNCLLFDGCQIPHFSYVGDAILGYRAHLGAGAILSNVRLDRGEVSVRHEGGRIATGLVKFSAIIGDHAEIGCHAVISPGSLIGRRAVVYPGAHVTGVVPADHILKVRQQQQLLVRR